MCIRDSTNTVVEPEFAAMRPAGVTNQYRDIYIENARALSDEAFMAGAEVITGAVDAALRTAMTCEPDYLVMGVSAITFIGGAPACERFVSHVHELTGKQVSVGSVSCVEAMKAYGGIRRIAVLSPYYPMANMHVARYFSDYGITTVRDLPLRCKSWTDISRVTERQIADALKQLDGDDIDAVVQVGTNLSMARMAPATPREKLMSTYTNIKSAAKRTSMRLSRNGSAIIPQLSAPGSISKKR